MDREQARQIIREHLKDYLEGRGIDTKKPFACLAGTHPDRNPSMSYDPKRNKCHCFQCGASLDTLDLIGLEYSLTRYPAQLQKGAELYGLNLDGKNQNHAKNEQYTHTHTHTHTQQGGQTMEKEKQAPADYTGDFRSWAGQLPGSPAADYLQRRGISLETAGRFMLGYEPDFTRGTGGAHWQALMIPTARGAYVARNIDTKADKKDRYRKASANTIFNLKALNTAQKPLFVVEGELDALSIIEVGGEALALGSTANASNFIKELEAQKPAQPLVLSLDADEAGKKAQEEIKHELERLKLPYFELSAGNGYKDPNEALTANRADFKAVIDSAEKLEEAEKAQALEDYLKTSTAYQLQDFVNNIQASKTASFYPTGFSTLDKALDGGLYAGLYIVGAISSLGKTTFCLQIADQIAQAGQDVLLFSLEMARDELIAKSVSRETLIANLHENSGTALAKTTRGILTGARYESYSPAELGIIQSALNAYGKYAQRVYISVGVGNIGAAQIREKVEQHINLTGRKPIVVIDYLQIIAPENERATDKQNTDKAVLELKRLSRDFSIPILGISSFNRDNYTSPVNLASFKESGAIEYSSDVLLGLQYWGMDYQAGEAEKSRDKRVRELMKQNQQNAKEKKPQIIQVKILKNRNGSKGDSLLDFYPMFNYFTQHGEAGTDATIDENGDEWQEMPAGFNTPFDTED